MTVLSRRTVRREVPEWPILPMPQIPCRDHLDLMPRHQKMIVMDSDPDPDQVLPDQLHAGKVEKEHRLGHREIVILMSDPLIFHYNLK
jgi:hypothetical protein